MIDQDQAWLLLLANSKGLPWAEKVLVLSSGLKDVTRIVGLHIELGSADTYCLYEDGSHIAIFLRHMILNQSNFWEGLIATKCNVRHEIYI